MRKAQKQEIIECVNSLYQAHKEIRDVLSQGGQNSDRAMHNIQTMFCECQEFAVSLGEAIEKLEGEGHSTVARLEEYCEELFRCFEDIRKGSANKNKISQSLNMQLARVETSVKNDIVARKEIVFFPYKLKADQRDEETVKAIIKLLQEKEINIDRAFRILEDAQSILPFIAVLPPA